MSARPFTSPESRAALRRVKEHVREHAPAHFIDGALFISWAPAKRKSTQPFALSSQPSKRRWMAPSRSAGVGGNAIRDALRRGRTRPRPHQSIWPWRTGMTVFTSFTDFAAHLLTVEADVRLAQEAAVEKACRMVEKAAKRAIGKYLPDYNWSSWPRQRRKNGFASAFQPISRCCGPAISAIRFLTTPNAKEMRSLATSARPARSPSIKRWAPRASRRDHFSQHR